MHLSVSMGFEAAHRLPLYEGPCHDLHGHGYRFTVTVAARTDPATGMGPDFLAMRADVKRIVYDALDHKYLNDIVENPTAENLAKWMWRRLAPALPGISEIVVYEGSECWVAYRGDEESA